MNNDFTKEYLKVIKEDIDDDYENYNLVKTVISQLDTLKDVADQKTHRGYDEKTTEKYQNMSTEIKEMLSKLTEYATYFEDNFDEDNDW